MTLQASARRLTQTQKNVCLSKNSFCGRQFIWPRYLALTIHVLIPSIITARKRSLRRFCFHRCLSVHRGGLGSLSGGSLSWEGVSVRETPPGRRPTLDRDPPDRDTPRQRPPYSNGRVVRILLECILV